MEIKTTLTAENEFEELKKTLTSRRNRLSRRIEAIRGEIGTLEAEFLKLDELLKDYNSREYDPITEELRESNQELLPKVIATSQTRHSNDGSLVSTVFNIIKENPGIQIQGVLSKLPNKQPVAYTSIANCLYRMASGKYKTHKVRKQNSNYFVEAH